MSVWTLDQAVTRWGEQYRQKLASWVSYHFQCFELACRCGECRDLDGNWIEPVWTPAPQLMANLDQLRRWEKSPILISCGGRCPKHNKEVYESLGQVNNPTTLHVPDEWGFFNAADLPLPRGPKRIQRVEFWERLWKQGGIGDYKWGNHFDTGEKRESGRRW